MSEVRFVKVINHCQETIKVYLRRLRSKKARPAWQQRASEFIVCPGQESPPLPYNRLHGGKGWTSWSTKECVEIAEVPYEYRFVHILNQSQESVSIELAPAVEARTRERTTVTVQPDQGSRAIDLGSVRKPSKLNTLVKDDKISIEPIHEIGPSTGRKGAVASYIGESVYLCYRCGGPIIFRGSPPTPVHI